MENNPLVIRGAYYYNEKDDAIYVPHYTGEYWLVDADRFFTKKELSSRYDKKWVKENKDNYVKYDGKKYYYAEYSPIETKELSLLSDLSELEHQEDKYDW